MLAAQNGHTDIALHLRLAADISTTDMRGRMPLMEAALWGHIEILDFLLHQGASKQKIDKNGMQACDLVIKSEGTIKSNEALSLQ